MREYLTPLLTQILRLGSSTGPTVTSGTGTPEAVVTAPVGSVFLRTDGSAITAVYRKESGTGNTGWVAQINATVGTTAPSSPVTGQIWIDTN